MNIVTRQKGIPKSLLVLAIPVSINYPSIQRQGFEMKTVKWHFFTEQYQEPIIENGILCQHLIIFGKKIAS